MFNNPTELRQSVNYPKSREFFVLSQRAIPQIVTLEEQRLLSPCDDSLEVEKIVKASLVIDSLRDRNFSATLDETSLMQAQGLATCIDAARMRPSFEERRLIIKCEAALMKEFFRLCEKKGLADDWKYLRCPPKDFVKNILREIAKETDISEKLKGGFDLDDLSPYVRRAIILRCGAMLKAVKSRLEWIRSILDGRTDILAIVGIRKPHEKVRESVQASIEVRGIVLCLPLQRESLKGFFQNDSTSSGMTVWFSKGEERVAYPPGTLIYFDKTFWLYENSEIERNVKRTMIERHEFNHSFALIMAGIPVPASIQTNRGTFADLQRYQAMADFMIASEVAAYNSINELNSLRALGVNTLSSFITTVLIDSKLEGVFSSGVAIHRKLLKKWQSSIRFAGCLQWMKEQLLKDGNLSYEELSCWMIQSNRFNMWRLGEFLGLSPNETRRRYDDAGKELLKKTDNVFVAEFDKLRRCIVVQHPYLLPESPLRFFINKNLDSIENCLMPSLVASLDMSSVESMTQMMRALEEKVEVFITSHVHVLSISKFREKFNDWKRSFLQDHLLDFRSSVPSVIDAIELSQASFASSETASSIAQRIVESSEGLKKLLRGYEIFFLRHSLEVLPLKKFSCKEMPYISKTYLNAVCLVVERSRYSMSVEAIMFAAKSLTYHVPEPADQFPSHVLYELIPFICLSFEKLIESVLNDEELLANVITELLLSLEKIWMILPEGNELRKTLVVLKRYEDSLMNTLRLRELFERHTGRIINSTAPSSIREYYHLLNRKFFN